MSFSDEEVTINEARVRAANRETFRVCTIPAVRGFRPSGVRKEGTRSRADLVVVGCDGSRTAAVSRAVLDILQPLTPPPHRECSGNQQLSMAKQWRKHGAGSHRKKKRTNKSTFILTLKP